MATSEIEIQELDPSLAGKRKRNYNYKSEYRSIWERVKAASIPGIIVVKFTEAKPRFQANIHAALHKHAEENSYKLQTFMIDSAYKTYEIHKLLKKRKK